MRVSLAALLAGLLLAAGPGIVHAKDDPWKHSYKQQEKQAKALRKSEQKAAKAWAKERRKDAKAWERYERSVYRSW